MANISELSQESKDKINLIRNSIHFDAARKYLLGINCYSFSLGLDLSFKELIDFDNYFYSLGYVMPGDIREIVFSTKNKNHYYYYNSSNKKILEGIMKDMDLLGIKFETTTEDDTTVFEDNYMSWVVAMYKAKPDSTNTIDLHFIRKQPNGLWVHKYGPRSYYIDQTENLEKVLNPGPGENTYKQYGFYKLTLKK